jgi:putative membrane protein
MRNGRHGKAFRSRQGDLFFFGNADAPGGVCAARPTQEKTVRTPALTRFALTAAIAAAFTAGVAPPALAQQGPTDPQIAHIVVTANQVDIDAGKLAEKTSRSKDVKAFGHQMVTDHTAVNKSATDLVKKLKVKPEANDTSASLSKGGRENLASLRKLKGKDFDKAYVDHEVAYHQAVIDAVDKTLLPNARNAELKALIEKVRPALVQHLEHARHLQAQLSK